MLNLGWRARGLWFTVYKLNSVSESKDIVNSVKIRVLDARLQLCIILKM